MAAGGNLLLADMNQPAQERARGQHDGRRAHVPSVTENHTGHAPRLDPQIFYCRGAHLEPGLPGQVRLNRGAIELAVSLSARSLNRRAFAPIQKPKLNPGRIGGLAHDAAEGVYFPHQMTFADAADRRVARHFADGVEAMCYQQRLSSGARRSGRRLAPGMAASDDDHVERAGRRLACR